MLLILNSPVSSILADYRNKFVGHLFDKKTGKPLNEPDGNHENWGSISEGQTEEEFCQWWWSTTVNPN